MALRRPPPRVVRLRTFMDVRDDDERRLSARHDAVFANGRCVVLLDDRGWGRVIWGHETAEEIARTARVVVGPDEPFEGRTHAEMEASHWEYLARILREKGVEADAAELRALPHDVDLSGRVRARLRESRADEHTT